MQRRVNKFFSSLREMNDVKWVCVVLFGLVFLIFGCSPKGEENKEKGSLESAASTQVKRAEMILIPSSLEIIQVMQRDAEVKLSLLMDLEQTEDAHTSFQKAVLMGMIAANLGYMNLRAPASQTPRYFNRFKQLAEELQITNVFTDELMERVERNRDNLDSLQSYASRVYQEVIEALQEAGQEELIHLMLFSGWIEGMRFALETWKEKPTKELSERIVEQKITLEAIENAIKQYPKLYQKLAIPLAKLYMVFQPVQIQYSGEAKVRRVGNRIVVENSNQFIYTNQDIQNLIEAVNEARAYLLDKNVL